MPRRATKRGGDRTPLSGEYDVLICGASFAGLAVARQLAGATRADGSPARVLMIDRYEIGERQTSACGIPTVWLEALGLMGSHRQTFHELRVSTPFGTEYWPLPWTFSTFDYRQLCSLLREQSDCAFETAKVDGRSGHTVHTDRGELTAPLIVDAMGWRRNLAADAGYQPPDAPLSRGLEVHPDGSDQDLAIWIDRKIVPAGYGWSFPAGGELRIGVGSFDPRFHVKDNTVKLAENLGSDPVRFQGNWIPHKLRDSTEDGIFFAGDSAGHCLPLTAEGIRTALHFGLVCGDELRQVLAGARTREEALARYHAFNDSHEWKFRWMLRVQRWVPQLRPRPLRALVKLMARYPRLTDWAFEHYLRIAAPDRVGPPPERGEVSTPWCVPAPPERPPFSSEPSPLAVTVMHADVVGNGPHAPEVDQPKHRQNHDHDDQHLGLGRVQPAQGEEEDRQQDEGPHERPEGRPGHIKA